MGGNSKTNDQVDRIIAVIALLILIHLGVSLVLYNIDYGLGFQYYCLSHSMLPHKNDIHGLNEVVSFLKAKYKFWFIIPIFQIGSVIGTIIYIRKISLDK